MEDWTAAKLEVAERVMHQKTLRFQANPLKPFFFRQCRIDGLSQALTQEALRYQSASASIHAPQRSCLKSGLNSLKPNLTTKIVDRGGFNPLRVNLHLTIQ